MIKRWLRRWRKHAPDVPQGAIVPDMGNVDRVPIWLMVGNGVGGSLNQKVYINLKPVRIAIDAGEMEKARHICYDYGHSLGQRVAAELCNVAGVSYYPEKQEATDGTANG